MSQPIAASSGTASPRDPVLSDEDLLAALRDGDDAAYEALWVRHVDAARRAARRIAPLHADDLVSEAFLAIYDQVRVRGGGPVSSFRAYLFTIMRNTAARWHRTDAQFVATPDVDDTVEESGLRSLEREYDGALLLSAFRSLPNRWQRVLWLTEIENARRAEVAAELGIRPNALSALHGRARQGLRVQWLHHQIPEELRDDTGHVAHALPALIVGAGAHTADRVIRHLEACERCRAVELELRSAYRAGRKTVVSISGLGALGVVLPGATSLAGGTATAVAAGLALAGSAAVVAGALVTGLVPGLLDPWIPRVEALPGPAQPREEVAAPTGPVAPPRESSQLPIELPPPLVGPETPPVESIDIFWDPASPNAGLPERPPPATPATPGTVVPPDDGSAAPPPGVVVSAPSSTFLAPVLSGTAQPETVIAVAVDGLTYTTEPSEAGDWTFDLRTVPLAAGTHLARVWTVADGVASTPAIAEFTIEPLGIDGLSEYQPITLGDGMGDGLRFTLRGAPGGTVCIDSDTGQSAQVALDGTGSAQRVLRFWNYGLYVLRVTPCDGDAFGPDTPRTVSVVEGVFDPWVMDDVQSWEISEE
ncbi:sigma-70 family RNA polymerase sigma factor [Agromyces mediolanus]|uniref:RNA polymerase sigma-70 region 2 domain-containing protein n=1 Tax=Agromyces mediolanus TaxID=41986 RepID=A0A918CCT1_AGRME|nr:sigma-70 family RNA polymerase sigma factor [Agromyces mediolanus]GGR17171.1 hypothetical protein GCM10010196_07430 [Agromyces mediolanus]GLJ71645.1 hypothetical protein GCM10017583_09010 [Agromyces mediolanus]